MRRTLLTVSICSALALFAGCSSTQTAQEESEVEPITAKSVHRNMSPELDTRSMTSGEIDTRIARTIDTNGRSAWDDLMNFFLLNRPSRQSLYPTP